jgi:hypothetical protein
MTSLSHFLAAGVLLGQIACGVQAEDPRVVSVRGRAQELLSALRQKDWGKASSFVVLDDETRQQMGIPEGADRQSAQGRAAAWFERLYGTVVPGAVQNVVISRQDPSVARVTYRHDDLDAFTMRLVDGKWFYTLRSP